jgi:hypothetical protein
MLLSPIRRRIDYYYHSLLELQERMLLYLILMKGQSTLATSFYNQGIGEFLDFLLN